MQDMSTIREQQYFLINNKKKLSYYETVYLFSNDKNIIASFNLIYLHFGSKKIPKDIKF